MKMDYKQQVDGLIAKITSYIQEDDSLWKSSKKADKEEELDDFSKSISISMRPSAEFEGNVYKSVATLDASPEIVFSHCNPKPGGSRVNWDQAIKGLELVESVQNGDSVEKTKGVHEIFILRTMTHSAAMGLISGRDFIDLVINVNNDDFIGTIAHSVETDSAPPQDDFVRGKNYYCGILCFRVPGNPQQTRVYHIAQSDIGGMIPRSLVESSLPSAVMDFYVNLRKVLSQ